MHISAGRCWISDFCGRSMLELVLLLAAFAAPVFALPKNETFKIPPVKIPLNIKDQRVTIVALGLITMAPKTHGLNVANLELTADLSDLQQNLTALLGAELDKDDRCADRIQIQSATLTPNEPASLVVRSASLRALGLREVVWEAANAEADWRQRCDSGEAHAFGGRKS